MTEAKGILDGLKVADFTWVLAGPLITKTLADHGATVVRVESPQRPDVLRTTFPYKDGEPGLDRGGYFAAYNPNKYSLGLNLGVSKGLDVAKRLAVWADVLVENFSAGTLEKWGMGYEELKKINPGLIVVRSNNQGQTGPFAGHSCYGVQLAPFAGFAELIGWPDMEPSTLLMAWTDFISPQFAVSALLAALARRKRTGCGEYLDVSQLETSIHFLEPMILDSIVNGRENKRSGNSCSYAAPHNVYRCMGEERWCAVAVFTDGEWESLKRTMGNPSWCQEGRFSTLRERKLNEIELDKLIESWTSGLSAEQVMETLQKAGVAAGVVKNAQDIYEDPQLRHRKQFWMMEHAELGEYPHLAEPFILSKTPSRAYRPAPAIAEHTVHVCRELLGMGDEEFAALITEGVLE